MYPVLDYDEGSQTCLCRENPCWNDRGTKHECGDPKFPILRYREDEGAVRLGRSP